MDETAKYDPPRLGCKGCFGFGTLGIVFCLTSLLGFCVSQVEVMRATSPDGALTAKVVELNGGPTTDFAYRIDVARNWPIRWDHTVAGLKGAHRNDCAYGVNLHWIDSNTLEVTYKAATRAGFEPVAPLWGRDVRIIGKSGIDDPTAPCGGMEYSQQGKVAIAR